MRDVLLLGWAAGHGQLQKLLKNNTLRKNGQPQILENRIFVKKYLGLNKLFE